MRVKSVFAPEHGFLADIAAGADVPSASDPRSRLPIHSLYGPTKKPTAEMLRGLDVLVFDIQDTGARFYMFLYTMALAMEAAAEHSLPFIVLDRPNPIGGVKIEGPLLRPEFASFVGMYPIPIRTGMTIGELALLFNAEFGIAADLRVIPLDGWMRSMCWDRTALKWVAPSPNIPSPNTALLYPGTCLLEGTNVSEGRGTSDPFGTLGAPWIDPVSLADTLRSGGLPDVSFEPARFTPTTSKHCGATCGGVQILVTDRETYAPVLTGLKIIEVIHGLWPREFEFTASAPGDRFFFDLLAGDDSIRLATLSGKSAETIASGWDTTTYQSVRLQYLQYN